MDIRTSPAFRTLLSDIELALASEVSDLPPWAPPAPVNNDSTDGGESSDDGGGYAPSTPYSRRYTVNTVLAQMISRTVLTAHSRRRRHCFHVDETDRLDQHGTPTRNCRGWMEAQLRRLLPPMPRTTGHFGDSESSDDSDEYDDDGSVAALSATRKRKRKRKNRKRRLSYSCSPFGLGSGQR